MFAREMPAWCGADGMPRSWRHYMVGMGMIGRVQARETLRMFQAVGMAQTDKAQHSEWLAELKRGAGW